MEEKVPKREWMMFVMTPCRDMTVAKSNRCNVSHKMGRMSSFADMEGLLESSWLAILSGNAEKSSCIERHNARVLH